MSSRTGFWVFLALVLAGRAAAAERPAANAAELAAAIAQAQAGDVITLADGPWRDATINVSRGGSSTAPLRLRAKTPGQVVLSGNSSLLLTASHVQVEGLRFEGAQPAKGNVVHFDADDCRVTECAILDSGAASARGYYYVYFNGNRNRLDHCVLAGKANAQPVVGNDINGSRYNAVEFCHFRDIAHNPENGREVFRIWGYGGNEELGPDGAFFTIAHNLFERAHGEGQEIISLKSNRNVVRNNTIRATRGGITNRSGNYNTIEGNFIFGDGTPGTYGMRITGQHHTIAHNYIEGVGYGINVMAGELFLEALTPQFQPILREGTVHGRVPAYNQPRSTTVAYNTLVNITGLDLEIGGSYKAGWPRQQRILLPEHCYIAHNLIHKASPGPAVSVTAPDRGTPEIARLAFAGNRYHENLVSGGTVRTNGAGEGFVLHELKFERDAQGALRPVDKTLAQSSAAAAPSVFSKEPSPFRPLTAADVGPDWLKTRELAK